MNIEVYNIEGKSTGRSIDLPDSVFSVEPNEHTMYLAVKSFLAAQRQGTHKAKEKGEITASTKKIKRQKGTGTARAGSLKSGVFRGGGRMFGPRPRTYSVKLNRKVNALARRSALSQKAADGKLRIVEDFTFDQPKTKEYVNVLNKFDLSNAKSLMVSSDNKNLYLSARNCANSKVLDANSLNTYEILKADTLLISESAVKTLSELLGKK